MNVWQLMEKCVISNRTLSSIKYCVSHDETLEMKLVDQVCNELLTCTKSTICTFIIGKGLCPNWEDQQTLEQQQQ